MSSASMNAAQRVMNAPEIPEAPTGWRRLALSGPGCLWLLSVIGPGDGLLFTPRIAAIYGFSLLWLLLLAFALKWCVSRETGRFTVCTGARVLEGFSWLPGPRHWALWLTLLPQTAVAATLIAGVAGAASTALALMLPVPLPVLATGMILATGAVILGGQYDRVYTAIACLAVPLLGAVLVAAFGVFPDWRPIRDGLTPRMPERPDYWEILPWLGFAMAGAAGLLWHSWRVAAWNYGAAAGGAVRQVNTILLDAEQKRRLKGWLKQMVLADTAGVAGALVVALAFLTLGAQELMPARLLPGGERLAGTLAMMLGGVWGPWGYQVMLFGVLVMFTGMLLCIQQGFARMFAEGSELMLRPLRWRHRWMQEDALYVIWLAGFMLVAVILFWMVGEPIRLLRLAGVAEAMHIPLVTGMTLFLNITQLDPALRPGGLSIALTTLAGLFFLVFALAFLFTGLVP